jgi:hypothetical protein
MEQKSGIFSDSVLGSITDEMSAGSGSLGDKSVEIRESSSLKDINKKYPTILITDNDIILTLADTNKKVSVNELVAFWERSQI